MRKKLLKTKIFICELAIKEAKEDQLIAEQTGDCKKCKQLEDEITKYELKIKKLEHELQEPTI